MAARRSNTTVTVSVSPCPGDRRFGIDVQCCRTHVGAAASKQPMDAAQTHEIRLDPLGIGRRLSKTFDHYGWIESRGSGDVIVEHRLTPYAEVIAGNDFVIAK